MSRGWRVGLGIAAALVALNVFLRALEHLTGGTPGGPTSSAYATAPDGLAAYAELMARTGHPVRRVRKPAAEARLEPGSTAVLLDPSFVPREDVRALRRFVERGGRLVAGGADARWLRRIVGSGLAWSRAGVRDASVLAPVPETHGVEEVEAAGGGAWTKTGAALPAIGERERAVVAVASVGRGRVVAFADASPLQNRALGRADNAQLGLAVAGPRARPVRFLESYHGYGEGSGAGAIPDRWLTAFALGLLASAVLMIARGRRLGPPEPEARELPPPRRLYVESLAGVLARSRRPGEAVAPVRERAARLLAEATPAASDDAARAAAARRLGLGDAEVAVLEHEPRDGASVLAAGRALAQLERRHRGRGAAWRRS